MTVAELIEQLRQLPADLPVLVEGYETGWDGIHELRTAGVMRYRRAQDWDGECRTPGKFVGKPFVLLDDEYPSADDECKQTEKPAVLIVGRRGHRR